MAKIAPVRGKSMTPREIARYYEEKGLSPRFCAAPFLSLVFEAPGHVRMCRRTDYNFAIGDVRNQTLEQIWNGEAIQGIRREFLSGEVRTCAKDIARKRCNLSYSEFLPLIEYSVRQTKPPLMISPNFNGQCNLECDICDTWRSPNGVYDRVGFWKELEETILPHLQEIDTFSGEPFIQKDTYRLMDLAAKVNPSIRWSFTTNGNWRFSPAIRSRLDKLTISTMTFSLDSLDPEVYVRTRGGGRLEVMLETLDDVIRYERERVERGAKGFEIGIICTIQKRNWKDVPALIRFHKEKGIRIMIHSVLKPEEHSLLTLSASEKAGILDYYLENIASADLGFPMQVISILLEGLAPLDKAQMLLRYNQKLGRGGNRIAPCHDRDAQGSNP